MVPLSKTARDFSGTNLSLFLPKPTSREKIFSPHLTQSVSTYEMSHLDAAVDAEFA